MLKKHCDRLHVLFLTTKYLAGLLLPVLPAKFDVFSKSL